MSKVKIFGHRCIQSTAMPGSYLVVNPVCEEIAKGSEEIYPDPLVVQFAAGVQADFKVAEKANAAGF